MAHNIETMAYTGAKPWHGLGIKLEPNPSVDEILEAAGLNWEVKKAPLLASRLENDPFKGKGPHSVPDYAALVRDSDHSILGVCGNRFEPTQNRAAFMFFDKFVKAGKMNMDTAGSLLGGKWTWALAKINQQFELPGEDVVESYMLFSNPHIWGKSIKLMYTPVRVVCNNTLTYALGSKSTEKAFTMAHNRSFGAEDLYKSAEEVLGLSQNYFEQYKEAANFLASKKVKSYKDTYEYMLKVFGYKIDAATNDNMLYENLPHKIRAVLDSIKTQPGAELKSSRGTWWGVYNAATYTIDHVLGKNRDTALASAWFGPNAAVKHKALNEALKMAA
jgi:phage/plasmid-like protein (TIGR03299 family)